MGIRVMLATDDDLLAQAEAWKRGGRGVALATVVETWGSAPRPVGARADAQANVRTWAAPPLHVALCSADASALAGAHCEGLALAAAHDSFWHVHRAVFAN